MIITWCIGLIDLTVARMTMFYMSENWSNYTETTMQQFVLHVTFYAVLF